MDFSTDTIYKDLIRMVHPDLHPELNGATEKAQRVNLNKNNPSMLRILGIEWGFIIPTSEDYRRVLNDRTTRTAPQRVYTRPQPSPFVVFSVEDGVQFKSGRYVGLRGIIVNIDLIKDGPYKGYYSHVIYVKAMDKLVDAKMKTLHNTAKHFAKYSALTSDVLVAKRKWTLVQQAEKSRATINTLSDIHLKSNTNYRGENITIRVWMYGSIHSVRVVRTTAKCIIVMFNGMERLVRLSSVVSR
jgi:hypothetical protein